MCVRLCGISTEAWQGRVRDGLRVWEHVDLVFFGLESVVATACEETSMFVPYLFLVRIIAAWRNRFGVVGGYLLLRIWLWLFNNTTDVVQYT